MFERLLVPLDGSRLAEAVLPASVLLAQRLQSTIVLLHIVEESPPQDVHGETHLMAAEEATAYLQGVVSQLAQQHVPAEIHVHPAKESDVARSISDHAQELQAGLIILCAHGRGGLRDVLVGSIAQQVIHRGATPVFLTRARQTETVMSWACERILLPLDGTLVHEPSLPVAAELARACGSVLHLLTVVPTTGTLSPQRAATGVLLPSTMTALLDMAQEDAVDYLRATTNRLLGQGLKASAEVRRGDPAGEILEEITHLHADLVVMATHGRTTMEAFWSGGVTPKIVSQAPVPVLLVRVSGEEAPR